MPQRGVNVARSVARRLYSWLYTARGFKLNLFKHVQWSRIELLSDYEVVFGWTLLVYAGLLLEHTCIAMVPQKLVCSVQPRIMGPGLCNPDSLSPLHKFCKPQDAHTSRTCFLA